MSVELKVWDAANLVDREAWLQAWALWPEREVFAHPDYVRLYAGAGLRALCVSASAGGGHVLYPFLLRPLGDRPYCGASLRDCTDIATPYGYGGPFRWGTAWDPETVEAFWREFDVWAAGARVVSEVVRLSLFQENLVEYTGEQRVLLDNVVRTLGSEEELWREFDHKVRKNVKKAGASGVTVQLDEGGERLDDFLAIYRSTMDRRNAGENYYFPREYFERIGSALKGQFAWFHAFAGGTVISTELVLVSADRVYSFLGGTDAAWFHVRPNDLLKVEIMNWARNAGKTAFVLGGGYARNDGIYRYKLAFAPDGAVPFSIGSRIFDAGAYEELVQSRRNFEALRDQVWQPNADYFPAYRG